VLGQFSFNSVERLELFELNVYNLISSIFDVSQVFCSMNCEKFRAFPVPHFPPSLRLDVSMFYDYTSQSYFLNYLSLIIRLCHPELRTRALGCCTLFNSSADSSCLFKGHRAWSKSSKNPTPTCFPTSTTHCKCRTSRGQQTRGFNGLQKRQEFPSIKQKGIIPSLCITP